MLRGRGRCCILLGSWRRQNMHLNNERRPWICTTANARHPIITAGWTGGRQMENQRKNWLSIAWTVDRRSWAKDTTTTPHTATIHIPDRWDREGRGLRGNRGVARGGTYYLCLSTSISMPFIIKYVDKNYVNKNKLREWTRNVHKTSNYIVTNNSRLLLEIFHQK